jgi:hypothetical protein
MKRAGFAAVLLGTVLGVLSPAFAKECPAFTVAVTFRYVPLPGEEVRSVSLRGSFNNWGEWPMEREPDGSWAITVCLEPGEYQYKFYINGQWPKDMATARGGGPVDPEAHGYVDDGFGGQNAVRIVTLPVETFFAHHDPANPAFLCRADGRWVVRLLVAPGFVESVTVATDYGSWPMERQLFWDSGEMWRVSLDLPFGFSYRFHTRLLGGEEQTLPEGPSSFSAPEEDPFPQVAWVGKSVGYQIFPDRFYNGDPANDALALDTDEANFSPYAPAPILSAWNDPITPLHCCHQYFGGDLRGIREKLDYLAQLGVGLIYLKPDFRFRQCSWLRHPRFSGGGAALGDQGGASGAPGGSPYAGDPGDLRFCAQPHGRGFLGLPGRGEARPGKPVLGLVLHPALALHARRWHSLRGLVGIGKPSQAQHR